MTFHLQKFLVECLTDSVYCTRRGDVDPYLTVGFVSLTLIHFLSRDLLLTFNKNLVSPTYGSFLWCHHLGDIYP